MTRHLGVDENGLGPQLGPLIVTGVSARLTPDAIELLSKEPSVFLHGRLADSKQVVAHGRVAVAEAWARVIVERTTKRCPHGPDELLELLSADSPDVLSRACPAKSRAQCWRPWSAEWHSDERAMKRAEEDLDALVTLGVQIDRVSSVVICSKSINEARRKGVSRLKLDLQAMERLILDTRAASDTDIEAFCGKVGGLKSYVPKFATLAQYPTTVVTEHKMVSEYRVAGVGRVTFLQDAENQHPLIALASLVGKAVRELWMDKIVDFYRERNPELPRASGYNDPVSDRFVRETATLRQELGIADDCFRREQRGRSSNGS